MSSSVRAIFWGSAQMAQQVCPASICSTSAIGEGSAQVAQKVSFTGICPIRTSCFFCAICGVSGQVAQTVCFSGVCPICSFRAILEGVCAQGAEGLPRGHPPNLRYLLGVRADGA